MPQLKPIPKLQEMALKKVAMNIFRYVAAFQKPKSRLQEKCYRVCQAVYSDQLLHLLIDTHWDERKTILQQIFSGTYNYSLYENCRDFIFNEHLTELILKSEKTANKYLEGVPKDFLQTIVCKKLTEVYYAYDITIRISLESFVQHSLTNVVSLNLKQTYCAEDISYFIWRYCRHIKYLNLSSTLLTDSGMLCLCNKVNKMPLDTSKYTYCYNPLECSRSPQLKVLIIEKTSVTNIGLQCALQHLTSLKVFRFRRLGHSPIHSYNGSIPRALSMLYEHRHSLPNVNPEFTTNLEELTVFTDDQVEDLRLIPALCPRLRALNLHIPLRPVELVTLCDISSITEVSMNLFGDYQNYPPGMRTFFSIRGERLTSLEFHGLTKLFDAQLIYHVFYFCPNLRHLNLNHFRFAQNAVYLSQGELNRVLQMFRNLESLTFSCISGDDNAVKDFLYRILVNTPNLRQLTIEFFWPYGREYVDKYFIPALTRHGFPELRELVLARCQISEDNLELIVSSLVNLRKIKYTLFRYPYMLRRMEKFASERNLDVEFHSVNSNSDLL